MKNTMRITIASLSLLVIALGAFTFFYFTPEKLTPENPAGKTMYYTVVNNDKVEQDTNKRYDYILTAYDEKGKEKELNFSASKQLREGAYLELYVTTFRGVTYWHEVRYEDLPDKVQGMLSR